MASLHLFIKQKNVLEYLEVLSWRKTAIFWPGIDGLITNWLIDMLTLPIQKATPGRWGSTPRALAGPLYPFTATFKAVGGWATRWRLWAGGQVEKNGRGFLCDPTICTYYDMFEVSGKSTKIPKIQTLSRSCCGNRVINATFIFHK